MTHFQTSKPLIKKFKTQRFSYIYDVYSNQLIKVDPIIYDLIDEIPNKDLEELIFQFKDLYGADEVTDTYTEIKKAQNEQSLFSLNHPEINCGIPFTDEFIAYQESNLNQLILELTEKCGMRCRYCAFSGTYSNKRSHGINEMSVETAISAVDFFIERSVTPEQNQLPAITFYGGEPLLRIDLIRCVVEHIKKKGLNRSFRFSFTTNGTLLTRAIVDYLVENHISISISIDGPKSIHDRYRRFINGEPTFDKIYSNLKDIKKRHPDYFLNHISFAAVAAPPYDFEAVIRFFFRSRFLAPLRGKVLINFVDDADTTFFRMNHLEEERIKLNSEITKLKNRYIKALSTGKYEKLTIEKQIFLKRFHTIVCRPIEPLSEKYPAQGTCYIGQRRLFVDVSGDFFMCEKVGSHYPLGT